MPGTPPTTPNLAIPRYSQADPASFSSQVNAISDRVDAAVQAALAALVPAGTLVATARTAAPTGWRICNGDAISRIGANSGLFAAIGETYGSGDGSTTFNVPDLRGRTVVGVDGAAARLTANDALGNAGGAEKHTLTIAELAAHTHTDRVGNTGTGFAAVPGGGIFQNYSPATVDSGSAGGGGAHNNMPPYAVANWMIKL